MKILDRVFNPREIRRRLGLNQEQFWTQIGVTQSGGSRYESGREMPRPVRNCCGSCTSSRSTCRK